jgi:aconitate hydratase
MSTVRPSLAGPKRPQDRVLLQDAAQDYASHVAELTRGREAKGPALVDYKGQHFELKDGAVVIAAITSCTNTSNPKVMLGAGLLARNAVAKGLRVQPWVKTSLGPGSRVVSDYLKQAGLMDDLEALGFNVVGYGCTTCIGNSGPLPEPIANAIRQNDLLAVSVLSGNRNFEGRVHADVKMNYLASPPLVVAYALAGRMDLDLTREPLGHDAHGTPVMLKDIWPSAMKSRRWSTLTSPRPCSMPVIPACSRATSAGTASTHPLAKCSTGRTIPPTSRIHLISKA